jgi:LAO/AO transport system kinase
VLELADVIAINKADGDRAVEAEAAARELAAALHLVATSPHGWDPPVLTCSAIEARGIDAIWQQLVAHRAHLEHAGTLTEHRRQQDIDWMWSTIDDQLLARFRAAPHVRDRVAEVERAVRAGELTATAAARALLDAPSGPR